MRLVVSDFMSLDGVVQAPGGAEEDTEGGFRHGGWSMPYFDVAAMGPAIGDAMASTDALLFGRRTYLTMAAAWPGRAGDPFADRMNEMTKYVASRTLSAADVTWNNSTLLPAGSALDEVRRLKATPGGDIQVMGSPGLARALIAEGLVDEYKLMIEPILLGGGKRLFPDDGEARPMELVSTTTASTGVLICTYRHAG
jgi:dihydrofolate reductase